MSPLGRILIRSEDNRVVYLGFSDDPCTESPDSAVMSAVGWLDVYFSGNVPDFTPPLKLTGTPFRETVWEIISHIPYGSVITYKELARLTALKLNRKTMSAQAVGGTAGKNPVAIITPCHRIVGVNGDMTGYAYGIERKKALLELEKTTKGMI